MASGTLYHVECISLWELQMDVLPFGGRAMQPSDHLVCTLLAATGQEGKRRLPKTRVRASGSRAAGFLRELACCPLV